MAALERHGIGPIDLVVAGLYPFETTAARSGVSREEAIEQIDIGGPAMIRAAAKNHAGVAVVTHPSQYEPLLAELRETGGELGDATRARLAHEAFRRTADYDAAIASYLGPPRRSRRFPIPSGSRPPWRRRSATARIRIRGRPSIERPASRPGGWPSREQLHGPELSYNNLLDFSAALAPPRRARGARGRRHQAHEPVRRGARRHRRRGHGQGEGLRPGVDLRRHRRGQPPPGPGGGGGAGRHLRRDPVRPRLRRRRAWPSCGARRRGRASSACPAIPQPGPTPAVEYRSVLGGLLAQAPDRPAPGGQPLKTVSRREPTAERNGRPPLRLAGGQAREVECHRAGAGRPGDRGRRRADEPRRFRPPGRHARARGRASPSRGRCAPRMPSFRSAMGWTWWPGRAPPPSIHPGGSLRDEEVIAAADEHGMAMVLTGVRHFRH